MASHIFSRSLLGLIAGAFLSTAVADAGTDWLLTRFNADGSFYGTNDIATPFQATAETLRALESQDTAFDTTASLQYLANEPYLNTENLARRIIANAEAGRDSSAALARLLQNQNSDGGFGGLSGGDSNALDTAFAAEALFLAGRASTQSAGFALGFLLNTQKPDGSWSLKNRESSVYISSLAMRSVWHYRRIFNVTGSLDRARTYLLGQRDAAGSWGETFKTALSLIAVAPTLSDHGAIENSIQSLRRQQAADGSFSRDAYQTALALRALKLSALPNPDEIRVSGRIIDGDTGLPLAGVTVLLSGAASLQTATDSSGGFVFSDLAAGNYQFHVSPQGYSALTSGFALQSGQQIDLGDLPLLKMIANPTTGAVIGTVTNAADGTPLAGVSVSVTGTALSVLTDSNGQFQINGVPPGALTVQAVLSGFVTATGSASIAAGQTLVFSPALPPLEEAQVIVAGTITDRETGAPLAGVVVSVQGAGNNASATTDAAGQYQIMRLQPGALTLSAVLAGYHPAGGTITVGQSSRIEFSPALVSEEAEQPPLANSAVRGVVVDSSSGLPLAGVTVALATAGAGQTAVTEADGRFLFTGLAAGDVALEFTLAGYHAFNAAFALPQNVSLDVGEIALRDEAVVQTAAVRGRVVDSRTDEPLAGVSVVARFGSGDFNVITGAGGEFAFSGIDALDGALLFTLGQYSAVNYGVHLTFGEELDLGDIRMRPENLSALTPDLQAVSLDTAAVVTDLQTLQVSGSIDIALANRGNAAVERPFAVLAFYDRNANGVYEAGQDTALGRSVVETGLSIDQELRVVLTVAGVADFRDEPVGVWLDSNEELVELAETNNILLSSAACRIVPQPLQQSPPVVKWHWRASSQAASSVFGPAMVGQLSDDNGDGLIDETDIPDVVFTSDAPNALNAISGANGSPLWRNTSLQVTALGSPALGDIDGDGVVEIVVANSNRTELFAFEHTGTLKWRAPTGASFTDPRDGIAIADLNGDGSPEIIHGRRVFNANGTLRWEGANDRGDNANYGYLPVVADVNLDGSPEVIAGRTLYSANGATLWHRSNIAADGFTAVGNFDADDFAEIVLVSNGRVYLLQHSGETIWGPVTIPGGGSVGAPTVADLDGDGQPEIGVAGARFYVALETDGSIKWTSATQDLSSHRTGSSVFDFEDDGRVEVLYADELFFRIYDGRNGSILFQLANGSGTTMEYPVVADIDGDNHAEVLLGSNSGATSGLRALEAANDSWANTRRIWNQHSYHINNVNNDGTIPAQEQPSWLSHNTYRLNTFVDRNVQDAPDLTVAALGLIDNGTGQPFSLRARYGNAGSAASDAGVISRFYKGDPLAGGVPLGTLILPAVQAGRFVDLQLNGVNGIAAGDAIFVVVDDSGTLEECRENNNRAHIIATGIRGQLQLSLQGSVFPPQADIALTNTVTNTGALAAGYRLDARIEDASGALVFAFATESVATLAPGGSTDVVQTWNSGSVLAGDYFAVTVLRDAQGNVLDTDSAVFAIAETGQALASLRTTTDKQQYHTTDTVRIENLLRNISLRTVLADTVLRLQVTSPSGAVLLDTAISVGGLAPGELRDLFETLELNRAEQGAYSVDARLEYASGGVLAVDQAQFTVVDDTRLSLAGAVQARSSQLFIGDTQACTFTAANRGTVDLAGQELWLLLVNVADGTEVSSERIAQDLPADAATDLVRDFATGGLAAGDYACVLQTAIDGERLGLAHSVFRLEQQPILIEAELALGQQGRVLVWMDDEDRHCKHEDGHGDRKDKYGGKHDGHGGKDDKHCGHHRNDGEPDLRAQQLWLEQTLDSAGIAYTLVTNESAFVHKFRSGEYNQYLVLAEKARLHPHFVEELREAVYRGEGLIVAGGDLHPLHKAVRETLGLKLPSDHDSEHGYAEVSGIELFESDYHPAARQEFAHLHRVLKVQHDTAQVLGRFTGVRKQSHKYDHDDCDGHDKHHHHAGKHEGRDGDDRCKPRPVGDVPAATRNIYGEGRAMYIGFDVLSEAARSGADPLFGEMLLQALRATRPAITNTRAGAVVPIVLGLENMGVAVAGEAILTLPAGSRIVNTGGGVRLADNSLSFAYALSEQAQAQFIVWAIPAYSNGRAAVDAVVQSGGLTLETLRLIIDERLVASADDIVQSLRLLKHEDRDLYAAWKDMKNAQRALARGDADSALHHLLKAADDLAGSGHPAAPALRRDIDWLLWRMGPELHGDCRHD